MYPFARLANIPFIWTHNGYQVTCVDGLGWFDGWPAPMTPKESLFFHLKKKGVIHFCKEAVKLSLRRYVADRVDLNIAATHWVAKRQPLRNQMVAYTPYPLSKFKAARDDVPGKYDFLYVGRLVSEKGVATLIQAFHQLTLETEHCQKTLAIVGDGEHIHELKAMIANLKIKDKVYFLGAKRGQDLIEVIEQATVGIIPSIWEEPMGGVSLELMAAGKVVITSSLGGHAECVDNAGLKFENGDPTQLSETMKSLVSSHDYFMHLKNNIDSQVEKFDESKLTQKYIEIYSQCIAAYS
jgi:glycosyltransferase involved in cell wall biosynthesis